MKRNNMKSNSMKLRPLLLTLAFATAAFVNAQNNFGGGILSDADNWSDGAPVLGNPGTIAVDGTWDENLTGWEISQTAGTVDSTFGRTYSGAGIYSLQGGELEVGGNFTFAGGSVLNQSGGSLLANNFAMDNTGGAYNVSGGTATMASLSVRFQGLLNFNAGGGSVTTDTLAMNGGVSRVLFTSGSNGSLSIGATPTYNNAANHFGFESGSGASLTITGFGLTEFETLWTDNRLRFDGTNVGDFSDNFIVSDSTLTVIPEPGTLALLGIAGLALAISQRRRRK